MSILKQQLEKLKQNQKADPILPDNSSATFLFDFKNANKIDKDTIFEIGYSAIIELARLDKKFIRYIPKLFNNTSKYFQRETKLKTELTEIDLYLENLIIDLIDYFHLKASHKIIEYLIKIFNFNAYNPKFLIMAFLPYHETKYFIKLVQNMNLSLNQNLKFLTIFAQSGTVLLEELLFKEILNNFNLIKEIFNFYEEKIIENSQLNINKKIHDYSIEINNFNSVLESKKYFKFLCNLINFFFENIVNNRKIDKPNFFLQVFNFLRINIKHFRLISEFSSKSNYHNIHSDSFKNNGEVNYIIENICKLIISINSKFQLSIEYSNAIINDIINNFLFHKNKQNFSANNSSSAELILKTILLFVNGNQNSNNFALKLNSETIENLLNNVKFDYSNSNKLKKNEKEKKSLFSNLLENLSSEYNFFPVLKLIINSFFYEINSIFLNNEFKNSNKSQEISNTFEFISLSSNIFQIMKIIKIQKEEIINFCNYLLDLNNLEKNEKFLENFSNNLIKRDDIIIAIEKLIEKIFIHIENIYSEEFNSFLIEFLENKSNDKEKLKNFIKVIDNYKSLFENDNDLFDLFMNLNTSNINTVSNSIEKIDKMISENKTEIVKFSFNSLVNKFSHFDQEFILKKILNMKNFSLILNYESPNLNGEIDENSNNKKLLKDEILQFYFKLFEDKINIYSNDFIQQIGVYVLKNFILDPNDNDFIKYFIYIYSFNLNLTTTAINENLKSNKFIFNLINGEYSLEKKIDEYTKILSSTNTIKSMNFISDLIKKILKNKTADIKISRNIAILINKLHIHEKKKIKDNCSSSVYLKLVSSIIEILNYINLFIYNFSEYDKKNNLSRYECLESLFFEITESLINNIFFHKDFLINISQISYLILNSPLEKIKVLFEKIVKYVFSEEIYHFLTYLIMIDYESFVENEEISLEQDRKNSMNLKFLNNLLEFVSNSLFNFENKNQGEKHTFDFGFLIALVYVLENNYDNNIRKKVLQLFDNLNKNINDFNVSFNEFNNLFGLIKETDKNNKSNIILKNDKIIIDVIKLISNNKTEILMNKSNLQKLINNSKILDFDFYLILFEYFISFSDEYNNFEIFYKLSNLIENQFLTKNITQVNGNIKNLNSKLNYESFNIEKTQRITKILFDDSIKNNLNLVLLQERVYCTTLDFFNKDENCLVFIVNTLLQHNNLALKTQKYSLNLINKISLSPLLSNIDFKTENKNCKNIENNNHENHFHFVQFIRLLIDYNIPSSNLHDLNKINFVSILEDLLDELKNQGKNQEKLQKYKEIIYFLFEIILKESSFCLDYALINLEYMEHFSTNYEIDSNFLVLSNNLFSILSANNGEFQNLTKNAVLEDGNRKIKCVLLKKIENIIFNVCENLAKKEKSINDEYYSNLKKLNNIYENDEITEMKIENEMESFDNEAFNKINYSFEYLNILNTLFLSLNKSIILQDDIKNEREIVLNIINKSFEIFSFNNKIEKTQDENMIKVDIGYKFKKDIFSVILNSIINFVITLLGTNKYNDFNFFFEYIETLVKLSILNFDDDLYLDNLLKKFLNLIKPFDNKLKSCLFVTIYYYCIEKNFKRYLKKNEITIDSFKNLIEKFSVFYDQEKENKTYYNIMISGYFEEIVELNYQKLDITSVANVLLIIEDILEKISYKENEKNLFVYNILKFENDNDDVNLCFFENVRNLIVNLCTKILGYIQNVFYLDDSSKLKEDVKIKNIVTSINIKILQNYKLSNQILNNKKENICKNITSLRKKENTEVIGNLTNIFLKNLKIFEDHFFDILIEANILQYLIINLYDQEQNEKQEVLLRNFLLSKYLNLIKLDINLIQNTKISNNNLSKSKKQTKNYEHYLKKYTDNINLLSKLIHNFDKEDTKNFENINLIFSILTKIIIFSEKFINFSINKDSKIDSNDLFKIIKESKRLGFIIQFLNFEENVVYKKDKDNIIIPVSYYLSKFSIFDFLVKFFTVYELKFYDLFNKFIKNTEKCLDVLYSKFYLSSNIENKETLFTILENIFELVSQRSEYLSPILEDIIYKLSLIYEENLTADIINRIFDALAKKQLFDVSFRAVKKAFKNYDIILKEKKLSNNFNKMKCISKKINSILTYFNTSIKYSDKLVITDINLKIVKFIFKILLDKNYNNSNKNNSKLVQKAEVSPNEELKDLSDSILSCLKSLILKMNEKQFKLLFDEFLLLFFKEEIDLRSSEDVDIAKVASKYKLKNCIVTLQVFNEIFEILSHIFVNYFEKYKSILLQILNYVNSVFCEANKNNQKKKKDREFFDENYEENNKFSYLNLSSLALKNVSLAFKYDKSILLQETIQETFEPITNQLKFIYFSENKYQIYFDQTVKVYLAEVYKNIKSEDLFREFNEMVLNLIREDHYQIRYFVIKLYSYLLSELKERLIMNISEIIPYITESLEDQNEKVQIEAFNLIKLIEKQTGEDIKNYIEN